MRETDLRERLRQIIEQMIDLMDLIDGDADMEDDATGEIETDLDDVPLTLNRESGPPPQAA